MKGCNNPVCKTTPLSWGLETKSLLQLIWPIVKLTAYVCVHAQCRSLNSQPSEKFWRAHTLPAPSHFFSQPKISQAAEFEQWLARLFYAWNFILSLFLFSFPFPYFFFITLLKTR
jgi:hypothetical protein